MLDGLDEGEGLKGRRGGLGMSAVFVAWLVGWLVGWLVCLEGWMDGWMVGCVVGFWWGALPRKRERKRESRCGRGRIELGGFCWAVTEIDLGRLVLCGEV